jgi:helicase
VLALSATIPNARELADWLDAELLESDYRPVPLEEGVFFNGMVHYASGKAEAFKLKEPIRAIVSDTVFERGKQALVFANTRKNAEGIALKLAPFVEKSLGESEKKALKKESDSLLGILEQPTEQCRRLSSLVASGVAFHHAGLLPPQRTLIEDAFRSNKIKLIAATPTLAAGVNLPSHTVIIPSLYRYTAGGMARIPVSEYKQQVGRAGRPRYDTEGRGIVVARCEAEKDELFGEYLKGCIEPVESRLGVEPVLRMHVLALVASGFAFDLASLDAFFRKTLYARQFSNMQALFEKLQGVLGQLGEMGFIVAGENRISATGLGRRVSELYLDPQSAFEMVRAMKATAKFTPFSYLFILCNCSELMPWLSVPKAREPEAWEQVQLSKLQLPIDLDREMYFDMNLLKKFNTAEMLQKWIDESFEQAIMDEFKVQPGILHSKLLLCDWLCYSALEIAKLLGLEMHFAPLSKLRKRLKYGVREELLPLTEVRLIGRVRARKLWRSNIRSVSALKNADLKDLGRILGGAVAESVKRALGQ